MKQKFKITEVSFITKRLEEEQINPKMSTKKDIIKIKTIDKENKEE